MRSEFHFSSSFAVRRFWRSQKRKMKMSDEIGRMTLEMPKDQKDILDKWLPFGMKKLIINSAISDICYMLEKYGSNYISAIVRKELNHRIEMEELSPKE